MATDNPGALYFSSRFRAISAIAAASLVVGFGSSAKIEGVGRTHAAAAKPSCFK
jgi:hypothetical protein